MKKTILISVLVLLAVGVVGVGAVFAQGSQPPAQGGYGWMHEYIEQALADKLGLTEAQIEEQYAAGKTMYQIALDNGITQEELTSFMNEVHEDAFAKAVAADVMTQEQADFMLQRMQNRGAYGTGNCPMHNGQAGQFGRGSGYGPGMMQNGGNGRGPGMMWGAGAQQNP
ncbi:MAG: hypothetical protein ABI621_11160 [Chloroflexota bacterium]